MALKDILAKIEKEGDHKIANITKEAEKVVKQITKEYSQKRTQTEADLTAKTEEKAEKLQEKTRIFAKMEGKNSLLTAKRSLINQTFEKAIESLAGSANYVSFLVPLLKKAAAEFTESLVLPAKGKESETQKAVQEAGVNFTVSDKTAAIKGGFILESGKIEVNFSFEDILLKQLRDQIEPLIIKTLF